MKSSEIRDTFLAFFAARGHKIVPSSSLIADDPTLLLTNAGMVQFKPYFLGEKTPPYTRAATVQKCFREIDLEIVGKTSRHFTFMEMLGNFSFGDYFKQDACKWGWELLTGDFGLDPTRLWITVHPTDEEAAGIWEKEVGVPRDRILALDANTWSMGVAGPCGPCSELLYDRGDEFGTPFTGGEIDEERYLEVWNLVFMQHIQDDNGKIIGDLPKQNIDTGMGLARLAAILQDVPTSFDVDNMAPLLRAAEEITAKQYGAAADTDIGLRVLAEHARSMSFLIADGVLPGNLGRGYVLRRLIRRALRHARLMGVEQPILAGLTEVAVDLYGNAYPELGVRSELIRSLVTREETRFDETLRHGLEMLMTEISRARKSGETTLSGDVIFKLQDTYGFPLDLSNDIASDEGLTIQTERFDELMEEQKTRARAARRVITSELGLSDSLSVEIDSTPTVFTGYESLTTNSSVVALLSSGESAEVLREGDKGSVLLTETPFYAESGGQVGDRGEIRTLSGIFEVEDTQKDPTGVIVHQGRVLAGEIAQNEVASASVDELRRTQVQQSHTATHILHWALREHLGDHAKQSGSLVEPGRLRFDFAHFEAVNPHLLSEIEEEINGRVLYDDPVRSFETTRDFAQSIGAMALFGEKYGEHVRVVEVGEYSKELCGGTHVPRTGHIGVMKIVGEGSVAAGTRRVEVLTGMEGLKHLNIQAEKLRQVADALKTDPEKVMERLEKLLASMRSMESELSRQRQIALRSAAAEILGSDSVTRVNGSSIVIHRLPDTEVDDLRKTVKMLCDALGSGVAAVGSVTKGRANLAVAVTRDLVERGISALALASDAGSVLNGGGGGKPDVAVAGGPAADSLQAALARVGDSLRRVLSA